MTERWITTDEAIAAIQAHVAGSVGYASSQLQKARASGEVRWRNLNQVLLIADDGVVGRNLRPGKLFYGVDSDGAPVSRHANAGTGQTSDEFNEADLLDWLNRNPGPLAAAGEKPLRHASVHEIRVEIFKVANDPANDRPNVKKLAKLVVPRLRHAGLVASENQVISIADEPEFKALRRPPGKTKRSGG